MLTVHRPAWKSDFRLIAATCLFIQSLLSSPLLSSPLLSLLSSLFSLLSSLFSLLSSLFSLLSSLFSLLSSLFSLLSSLFSLLSSLFSLLSSLFSLLSSLFSLLSLYLCLSLSLSFSLSLSVCFSVSLLLSLLFSLVLCRLAAPDLLIWDCYKDPGLASSVLEYEDVQASKVLQANVTTRQPTTCMVACEMRGFHFSGIRNITQCWCGREVLYRNNKPAKCTYCPGNHNFRCGDPGLISVYFRPTGEQGVGDISPNLYFIV